MIDLIIPYYNNPEGLQKTLDSINTDVFYITLVDDSSTIYMPYNPNVDQVLRSNLNRGPGYARQLGINKTYNPYIMFIDTGDIFISKEDQYEILFTIEDNPEVNLFSWQYYHKNELTHHIDNRLHGKCYRREIIDKYHITFSTEGSYLDEDIGFNLAYREAIKDTLEMRTDKPLINQILDNSSLTQKDDRVSLFRDQTRALSINSIHAINICKENNLNTEEIIYKIAFAQYYWFIRTAAERPQYLQDAWTGAKIFYDTFASEILPAKLAFSNASLKKFLKYRAQISFPINILRFCHEIKKCEIVPDYYLT